MPIDSIDLVRQALWITLLILAPILGVGVLVGLLVSLFQAVTQIQEQTLSFVPKIAVMVVISALIFGWITSKMVSFAASMFTF